MDLIYKGVNSRGRVEWVDKDLADSWRPEGVVMEEWQMVEYRRIVETTEQCIGRRLTRDEGQTLSWLAGCEQSTVRSIAGLIAEAHKHGMSKA